MSPKTKGTLLVLLCVVLWAMIPPAAKIASSTLDNHQFLFFSSLISFLGLLGVTLFYKKNNEFKLYRVKDWVIAVTLGLLGTYIYYLFLYLGYAKAKGLEVLVVQYTWPVSIVVLSLILLKEKLTIKKFVSVILGFVGVIIVLTKGDLSSVHINNIEVIFLVFFGASSFALFSVLSKKVHLEPISVTTLYFFVATVASFLSMNYFSTFVWPSFMDWLPILLNGLLLNGFSYLFWLKALKTTEASYLAPFVFITPVLSAIYLVILFNEPIIFAYAVGLACVIVSGLINSLEFKKKMK